MVDQVDAGKRSTLSWAAQRGDLEIIQRLLSRGADLNKANGYVMTPLHHPGANGFHFSRAALLGAGAEVDKQTNLGHITLMLSLGFRRHQQCKATLEIWCGRGVERPRWQDCSSFRT